MFFRGFRVLSLGWYSACSKSCEPLKSYKSVPASSHVGSQNPELSIRTNVRLTYGAFLLFGSSGASWEVWSDLHEAYLHYLIVLETCPGNIHTIESSKPLMNKTPLFTYGPNTPRILFQ